MSHVDIGKVENCRSFFLSASTLLKILAGQTDATAGNCSLGANLETGCFSQHALEVLNANHTVVEHLQRTVPNASVGTIKSLLGCFLFSDEDVNKKISVLSGGEKSRVALASILGAVDV